MLTRAMHDVGLKLSLLRLIELQALVADVPGYPIAPQASIRDWFHSDSRRTSPMEEVTAGLPDEPMGEPGPPEPDALEEIGDLLASLSEGDRERVLDLARRLSRK